MDDQHDVDVDCEVCGEQYPMRRWQLGYRTCLDCGERSAAAKIAARSKQVAPAYNKGPYMMITSRNDLKGIFKCGETK